MGKISTRQTARLERKKKKLAALLDLTELNEKDKIKKEKNLEVTDGSDMRGAKMKLDKDKEIEDDGPKRKRQKTDEHSKSHLDSSKREDKIEIYEEETAKNYNMSMDEYMQLRKDLKERKNMLKVIPRVLLNETGNQACVDFSCRVPLFMSDIQNFIICSQLGINSPVNTPRWCNIEKFNRIPHTVLLIVEGLTTYDLVSNESSCPNFADLKMKVEFLSPFNYDGILIEELAAVPVTKTQMNKLRKAYTIEGIKNGKPEFRVLRSIFPVQKSLNEKASRNNTKNSEKESEDPSNSDKFCRLDLLLSASQMVEEGYPIPLKGEMKDRYADYVMTKDEYTHVTSTSPMWALDCEMCLTSINKNELTRISIVDENCKTVYDTLVKPRNQIINYLTKFSGITKTMLKNVTTTLEDVQEELRRILPSDVILVGQSLNFDLHAIKMMHPYVIDTSVIFNLSGVRARKTKLAVLSSIFLNQVIQDGHGHDSIEDSATALKLVKLKLQNSIDFGDAVLSGPISIQKPKSNSKEKTNKIDEKNDRRLMNEEIMFTSLFSYLTRNEGKYASVIAEESILSNYETYIAASTLKEDHLRVKRVPVKSSEAVIKKTCEQVGIQSFVVAHLKLNKKETIQHVDAWCGDIFKSLAYNSLFAVILAGSEESEAHGAFMLTIKQRPLNAARFNIKSANT